MKWKSGKLTYAQVFSKNGGTVAVKYGSNLKNVTVPKGKTTDLSLF
jgi:hypothetical protein